MNNQKEPVLSNSNILENNTSTVSTNLRILIVDDQEFICRQLKMWLESEPDMEVVGTANDGATAINLIEYYQPNIVLIDLQMPQMDGFEATEIIAKRFSECNILIMSSSTAEEDIKSALKAGARGYWIKNNSVEDIVNIIRSAGKNHFQLSPGLFTKIFLPKLDSASSENTESSAIVPVAAKEQSSIAAKDENNMFRENSLARLSSPERLDQLMRVVNPKSWIPLATIGFLGATALTWSIIGRIPVTVEGAGVLIHPRTVVPIQTSSSGQLVDLKVKNGDLVKKGDLIATLDTSDRQKQLELAKAKLNRLQQQDQEANLVQNQRKSLDVAAMQEQKQTLEQKLGILQDLTPTLKDRGLSAIQSQRQNLQHRQKTLEELNPTFKKRLDSRQILFQQGAIAEDILLEARQKHLDNISSIDDIKTQLKELDTKETDTLQQYLSNLNEVKNIQAQIRELDSKKANLNQQDWQTSTNRQKEIQEVEREIAQIRQEINSESQIFSKHSGKILELTVNPGKVIQAGTRLANINTNEETGNLVSTMYFPVQDGKKIKPGMKVQITPQTIKRERFGGIVGTVTEVSPFPITTEAATNVVGNPQIISGLVSEAQPAVIQITAELSTDSSTFSGYQWSSSSGPNLNISSGTTTSVRVKLEDRAPITFVLPILRSISGIY